MCRAVCVPGHEMRVSLIGGAGVRAGEQKYTMECLKTSVGFAFVCRYLVPMQLNVVVDMWGTFIS